MQDMDAQQFARSDNVTLTAKLEDLVVLVIRSFHTVRQVQLEPGVSFSAVVDVADDGHEARLVGAGIEDGMKLPIQASPCGKMFRPAKFTDVCAEHSVRFGE